MTTSVDICNRALSEIGTRSTISSLTDGSTEAVACSIWYDTTRKQLLRKARWGFARTQATLTQVGDLYPDNTSPFPELYAYTYPPNCLQLRYIICQPTYVTATGGAFVNTGNWESGWGQPSRNNRFIVHLQTDGSGNQSKLVLANIYNALAIYTADVQNTEFFDELFTQALVSALAFRLVIPLSGNVGMRNEFAQAATEAILEARAADGNEAISSTDHTPDWMKTRFIGGSYGWNPYSIEGNWGMWTESCGDAAWGA